MTEFSEIGHSGGEITLSFKAEPDGYKSYQIRYSHSRPVPLVITTIYALAQGVPVASVAMKGIGIPYEQAPFPGCYLVMIQSDTEGQFGHNCPSCGSYWRSGPSPNICPYCGINAEDYQFLSKAQLRFVHHYCELLTESINSDDVAEVVIDMNVVADAANKSGEKPSFYVSEQSQQHKFACNSCNEINDILGRFGYCSLCGTRNDLFEFEKITIPSIRDRLNAEVPPQDCVRDAVASFDSYVAQYAKQLAALVPLTENRITRLTKKRFHDLVEVHSSLRNWFDIDLLRGINEAESKSISLMFHRRHVYEHNGGEVDQKYLDDSGDTTVKLKQSIRESKESAHELLGSLIKMARNLHNGFHTLFPPIKEHL